MKSRCVIKKLYMRYTNSERNKSFERDLNEIFKDLLDFTPNTRSMMIQNNFYELITYSIKIKSVLFTPFIIIHIHYAKKVKQALYIWYQFLCCVMSN